MLVEGVSIIVCCYNSENRIIAVLDHLAALENNYNLKIDVIIVDNNSKDNTQTVAKKRWQELNTPFPLNIVFEAKSGLIYARKTGIKNATQDYILFVDDDNLLSPDYLNIGVRILSNEEDIAVLGGIGIGQFESDLPDWINPGFPFKSLLGSLAVSTDSNSKQGFLLDKDDFLFGASSFYRKEVFKKLEDQSYEMKLTGRKGKELLSGEDQELCFLARIMGYKLYRSSELTFRHVIPRGRITMKYFEELYRGFGYSSVIISLYSELVVKKSLRYNSKSQIIKSKLKSSLFKILSIVTSILPNRFFKLKLLHSFEEGRIAFLRDSENLTEIKKSIVSISKRLNET